MAGKSPIAGMGSRDAIEAHAKELLTKITSTPAPSADVAVANAVVPSFSAGTAPLDPNAERPAPSQKTSAAIDGTPNVPLASDDAEAGAAAEAQAAGKAAAAVAADTRERGPDGKFASAGADKPSGTAPKTAPVAQTQAQKAAAAEAAADAILDEWADAQDLVFEHDDGTKYTVRAKRAEAKQVERFNRRQAIIDRAAGYLSKYRPALEPLITSGRLDPVLPVLQRATQDAEFRDFVAQAYNRRLAGLPMEGFPQQQQQTQPATGTNAPPAVAAPVALPEISDPYIAEALGPVLQPLMAELTQLRQQTQSWDQRQERERQQQAQQAAARQRQVAEIAAAHEDMAREYPGVFNPNLRDADPAFNLVLRYAQDGGYAQTYGLRGGLLNATHRYMRERAEAVGSPAAAMFEQADQATIRAARQQAASARAVTGGGAQAPAPQRVAPPQRPTPRDANGKLKPIREYQAETQQYAAAVAGA